jgi:hypothetical protein
MIIRHDRCPFQSISPFHLATLEGGPSRG